MNAPNRVGPPDLSVDNVEEELRALIRRLVDSTGADLVTLYLYDAERETFFMPTAYGLRDEDTFNFSRPRSDRIAGKVAKSRQMIIADDAKSHPDMSGPFTFRERVESSAGFPIVAGLNVVGVCFVSYRRVRTALPKMSRARFSPYWASSRQSLPAVTVADIAKRLLPRLPELNMVDRSLSVLIASACNFIHAPFGLWVLDERTGKLAVRAATGLRRQFVDLAALDTAAPNLLTDVVHTAKPLTVPEPATDLCFPFREEAEHEGWQSMLVVPIMGGGSAKGLLAVFSFTRRDYTDSETGFMVELAEQAAEVLMSEGGFSQIALDPQQASLALAARSALDQTLHLIVEKAAAAFGAEIVTLYPYDQDRDRFGAPVALGVSDDFWMHPEPSRTGIAARIAADG